ncbi:hydrogenase expression/formation protein HypE [Campylobacter sp. 19-13652]|uniref:hydrogenase expression/formation protein HypE n=1 Tax=Campylobacter sp. 19-13652 TaxID=2840180 RepID=UPI0021A5DD67|nr:hydrogenase expression/formation protein HypE [Campylobacter sp. 19-13652]
MEALINSVIFEAFSEVGGEILKQANDSAILNLSSPLAFSTDSFVVSPLFFAGGDIGKIAACGTINDLAMVGARAKYLSCALILEEGLLLGTLKAVLASLASECAKAGVKVVCGDTKVLPRGKCDSMFINTSGVAEVLCEGVGVQSLKDGAKLLLSGDIGRHGAVVLSAREEFEISADLKSDCKSLLGVVMALIEAGVKPLCMRDATRGGLSAVLNELSRASGLGVVVREADIAISDEVLGICEIFGFEPFELANEGTFVLAVSPDDEQKALEVLRKFNPFAAYIGELSVRRSGVILQSRYGTQRFLEPPKGELLPRIC